MFPAGLCAGRLQFSDPAFFGVSGTDLRRKGGVGLITWARISAVRSFNRVVVWVAFATVGAAVSSRICLIFVS